MFHGKPTSGFVMSERRNRWTVQLMTNDEVVFKSLQAREGVYLYNTSGNDIDSWRITCYYPICMKFMHGCKNNWQIMLCRSAFNKKNKLIQQLCS